MVSAGLLGVWLVVSGADEVGRRSVVPVMAVVGIVIGVLVMLGAAFDLPLVGLLAVLLIPVWAVVFIILEATGPHPGSPA